MLTLAIALIAAAGSYEQYQQDSETVCVGNPDQPAGAPETWSAAGHTFTVTGSHAEVKADAARKGPARIGVLAAIKDFGPETQNNLETFIAAFKKAGVNAIVVDGDSAYGVDDQDSTIATLFTWLGEQGVPVYVVIGNSESGSAFNRGVLAAFRKNKSVINLDLVRRVDADGFTLVSMPGYYDRRFIAETSGCLYKADDVAEIGKLARGAKSPVVLISHGPPRQSGKAALDVSTEGKNVGDPDMAAAMKTAKIEFGIFGHILESGGRATDLDGTHPVKPGTFVSSLVVNPGPAFSDPWSLNGGHISHGMAAILTIQGGKGEWQPLVAAPIGTPKPIKPPAPAKDGEETPIPHTDRVEGNGAEVQVKP